MWFLRNVCQIMPHLSENSDDGFSCTAHPRCIIWPLPVLQSHLHHLPLAPYTPPTLTFFTLGQDKLLPTSEPLDLLFPLPRTLFPQLFQCLAPFHPQFAAPSRLLRGAARRCQSPHQTAGISRTGLTVPPVSPEQELPQASAMSGPSVSGRAGRAGY